MLRHGETEWNVAGKFQGQKNSPLTAKGKAQAQLQYELLSGVETLPKQAFISRSIAPCIPRRSLLGRRLNKYWMTA